jgi:beta-1,4-mannosyltransferase
VRPTIEAQREKKPMDQKGLLSVYFSPISSSQIDYAQHLVRALSMNECAIREFKWTNPFKIKLPDVIHIQWPENLIRSNNVLKTFTKFSLLFLSLIVLKSRGAKVVSTGHNVRPHEAGFLPRITLNAYRFLSDGIIFLNSGSKDILEQSSYLTRRIRHSVIVELGNMTEGASVPEKQEARSLLGIDPNTSIFSFLGRPRGHKNNDGVIRCFEEAQIDNSLIITQKLGFASSGKVMNLGKTVDDETYIRTTVASDVAVFDFFETLNSASVATSLSLGVLTLAPRIGAIPDLASEYRSDLLMLFEPPLKPFHLLEALHRSKQIAFNKAPTRKMSSLSWNQIGRIHRNFYFELLGLDAK